MKKRMMSILLATVCIFSIGLTGCSGKEEKKEDGCFNQGTSMFLAEKDPTSYIAIEKDNSKFAIGLVVREEDENAEWVEPFLKAFRTEDTKKKIDEYYQGSYVYFD